MRLVEVTADGFGVDIDLVYATDRNFTGKPIYRRPTCYLHVDAAELLRRAVDSATSLGFRLGIFDGFRPAEAQWKLWEHCPNPDYIADPRRGSPHSMGVAVDLTLVNAASGESLDMGTNFDDLRPASWHGDAGVGSEAQRNRMILLGLMTAAGFEFYRNEWQHYQLFRPRDRYPVLSDTVLAEGLMPPKRSNTPRRS